MWGRIGAIRAGIHRGHFRAAEAGIDRTLVDRVDRMVDVEIFHHVQSTISTKSIISITRNSRRSARTPRRAERTQPFSGGRDARKGLDFKGIAAANGLHLPLSPRFGGRG
jgi:hypothetical protein